MERPGVRMQLLGGGCKQDQLQHENMQHFALLIYQPQWFTVIDVHIPECQNNLCFKRNQWLRLWFYLRPFPDKWLNCAWSWENTAEGQGLCPCVCVCGGIRERTPLCGAELLLVSAMRSTMALWALGRVRSDDSSVLVLLQGISTQPWCGSMVLSVGQHSFKECYTVINHCALVSLSCRTEVKLPATGVLRSENTSWNGVFSESGSNAYDDAYRDWSIFRLLIFWVRWQTTVCV